MIKNRLNQSLEEEKKYHLHLTTKKLPIKYENIQKLDLEEESESSIREELENILTTILEQQDFNEPIVLERKEHKSTVKRNS